MNAEKFKIVCIKRASQKKIIKLGNSELVLAFCDQLMAAD